MDALGETRYLRRQMESSGPRLSRPPDRLVEGRTKTGLLQGQFLKGLRKWGNFQVFSKTWKFFLIFGGFSAKITPLE